MNLAEAAEKIIPINPNIPGGTVAPGDPSAFVQSAYTFLFSVSGIIAFLALLYAAVLWASAGGNSSKVGEAKKKMNDVFLGLGILFGAYLLANFVDSSLTKIQLPKLEDAVVKASTSSIKIKNNNDPACQRCGDLNGSCNGTCPSNHMCVNISEKGPARHACITDIIRGDNSASGPSCKDGKCPTPNHSCTNDVGGTGMTSCVLHQN